MHLGTLPYSQLDGKQPEGAWRMQEGNHTETIQKGAKVMTGSGRATVVATTPGQVIVKYDGTSVPPQSLRAADVYLVRA
jgi:hypothetical protein